MSAQSHLALADELITLTDRARDDEVWPPVDAEERQHHHDKGSKVR